jgi:uncharacterized protein YnzC (UPF0291/DUF896 family)
MIIDLPKLGAVKFRDDLTPEQFNAEVQRLAEKYDFKMPRPDIGLGEIAKRSFMRSVGETGIAFGDTLPAMGASALGFNDYAKRQMEEAAQTRAELEEKYPTRFKSYTEVGGPREALEFVAETGGELLPSVGTALIPGVGFGALGARAGVSAATKLAAERGLGKYATEALIEKGAQAAGRRGMYGGVYMGSFAQNAPEVFEGIYQETGKFESGIAALAGGISAVLDSALPAKVFNGLGKYGKLKVIEELAKESNAAPKVWKYVLREARDAAAIEGLTESAQEAIGAYAKQVAGSAKGLFDPENIQQYKEAFVKGAIGGAGFGIPGGVAKGFVAKRDVKNTEEANKALAEQEQAEAGAVSPEKSAEYDAQAEQARAQREKDLTAAFSMGDYEQTKVELAALQARMDAARPNSAAYAELDKAVKDKQTELATMEAQKAKESAFATAVPDEQGLYRAQQIVDATMLKELGVSPMSKVARELIGTNLNTPEGVAKFVNTLENPAFKGKINEEAYDALIKTLKPQVVEEAARADLQGAVNARQPNITPSGEGATVDSATDQGAATEGVGGGERPRVVSTDTNVAGTNVGKEPTTPAIAGVKVLGLINQIDTNGGLQNDKIENYVKNNSFGLETIPASALPDLETLADKDDPYNRVLDPDENKISEYKKRLAANETAPPIVMDANGVILDGFHRAIAAKELNKPIQAYVAQPSTLDSKQQKAPTADPEKAFEEGKQAMLEGQGIDDHPYGDSEFAMYFQSGWLEQERELQSELNPEDTAPQNKIVEPEPKTTPAEKVEKPVADTTVESLELKPTPKVDATPDFTKDIETIINKLGDKAKKRGHTELEKDARAYFGRNYPDFALRTIANDIASFKFVDKTGKGLYRNGATAYRRAEMPAFKDRADGVEVAFTETEMKQHEGQGGTHAKNAEKWARANLSPESVAYLDKWIKKYTDEDVVSARDQKKAEKQQQLKKNVKEQIKQDELSPLSQAIARSDIEEDLGIKKKGRITEKMRKDAKRLAKQALEDYMGVEGIDDITDSGFNEMYASPDVASLYKSSHPSVLRSLRDGNLVDALGYLAETTPYDSLSKIAENLAKYVGNVNVVYGAKESKYDPKTNTIYLTEDATGYEVMHESAHAALSHILANPSHPITRQLDKLFKQVKGSLDGAYGATNLQEFAAELWSNPELRTKLKEMRTDSPVLSMWDKIMNVLRRILGFQPRQTDALDAADRLTNQIISVPPASRMGDSLYAQSIHNPNIFDNIFKYADKVTSGGTIMNQDTAVKTLASMEKLGVGGRQVMRKFLNLSALGQVASKIVGKEAIEFADNVNAMAGYYENMMEKLNPLHKRLEDFAQTDRYEAWSKLVNETTRLDVNPNADAETVARYRNDNEKFINYQQFKAEYNRLTDTEKKLYKDLFASYEVLFRELKASIRNNLLVKFPDDQEKALSVYSKIIDQITSAGVEHYAPLYRQGTYFLTYLDKNTNEHATELFESQIERAQKKAKLETQGHTDFEEKSRFDQLQSRNVPSGSIAGQIIKIMKDGGVDDTGVENFLQLIVSAMPETSLLKSFTKRKGTAGYINDAALAFSNVTSSTARQLSRMKYSEILQSNVDKMRETASALRGIKSDIGAEFVTEFMNRQKYAMNPSVADWARYASTGAFYFNLAGNVSSATVNFLQTPMIVLPQLGGTYGFLKAGAALMKATKLYGASGLTRTVKDINGETVTQKAMLSVDNLIGQGKNTEYSELFKTLKGLGFLQNSTARDALQAANRTPSGKGGAVPFTERVTTYSAFMFHHAERMNREVTAVAAFDLEMERLKNPSQMTKAERDANLTPEQKQQLAIEKAIRMVEFTHGAGHTESGPSIGHSDIGKVLTVFKRFGFTMYYMLFDTIRRSFPISKDMSADEKEAMNAARRQLIGVYGMAGMFAGVKGMPLYWIAETAYNALQDDDDEDFDTVMRKFLGDLIFKGPVNYFTNLAIADRVGWTDLIYRENKGGKADASALSQITEAILGAPYSVINSIYRGKELIGEGQFERGVEAMLPIALRNVLKGVRYATEGANTLRGDPVMGDVNGYSAAMQILGFAPADLLNKYEDNAYAKKFQDATVGQGKKLLKQYYIADRLGDYDRANMLRDKLFALSDKHDLGITEETISQSVTARDKISDEMYNGIQINKKIRNEIERSIMEMHD